MLAHTKHATVSRSHSRAPFTGKAPLRRAGVRSATSASAAAAAWTDEYTPLGDRLDKAPLPLPPISAPVRVTIVRHGQSTWNAESRVQGSSDLSVLTDKGKAQAKSSQAMLKDQKFDRMYVSPLQRAKQTADIIWEGREPVPRTQTPLLREIDLYSFQGLTKAEVKATYPAEYSDWHRRPDSFTISGHPPVRETWHRGSLAWRSILAPETVSDKQTAQTNNAPTSNILVVAHNNTNQALIATAMGLPCTYFRRLLQNNAAVSCLELRPSQVSASAPPEVVLECLNQSPSGKLFKQDDKLAARVALVCKSEDASTQQAVAKLMADVQVDWVLCGPYQPAQQAAKQLVAAQVAAGHSAPDVNTLMDAGSALASEEVWREVLNHARAPSVFASALNRSDTCVAVITDACATAALLCRALGMDSDRLSSFKISPGSITLLEFSGSPDKTACAVRCINSTAHLHHQQ